MNKHYGDRRSAGNFEVTRGGYRGTLRQNCGAQGRGGVAISGDTGCGCERRIEVPNSLGCECERARRGGCGCADKVSVGGCGEAIGSRYGLVDRPLGSVYSPLQDFDLLYDPERALARGTLFSALDLPLEVKEKGGRCRG